VGFGASRESARNAYQLDSIAVRESPCRSLSVWLKEIANGSVLSRLQRNIQCAGGMLRHCLAGKELPRERAANLWEGGQA
jgi:hypothetical protein